MGLKTKLAKSENCSLLGVRCNDEGQMFNAAIGLLAKPSK